MSHYYHILVCESEDADDEYESLYTSDVAFLQAVSSS